MPDGHLALLHGLRTTVKDDAATLGQVTLVPDSSLLEVKRTFGRRRSKGADDPEPTSRPASFVAQKGLISHGKYSTKLFGGN
jgi:hypothetical protein